MHWFKKSNNFADFILLHCAWILLCEKQRLLSGIYEKRSANTPACACYNTQFISGFGVLPLCFAFFRLFLLLRVLSMPYCEYYIGSKFFTQDKDKLETYISWPITKQKVQLHHFLSTLMHTCILNCPGLTSFVNEKRQNVATKWLAMKRVLKTNQGHQIQILECPRLW